jgi:glutathione S-transferase
LFAYTHCAEDGGFDLSRYPAMQNWLARVSEQPGFVAMPAYAAENTDLIAQSR